MSRPPRSRVLPHNLDAEASVLGGVLLRNDTLSLLVSLEVDDFYDHKHKVVFDAMRNLEAAQRPIDIVMLENEIAKTGKLDAIGGVAFLAELTLRVPTADNVEAYAEIVITKRITRQVMVTLSEIVEQAYLGEDGAEGSEGEQLCNDVAAAMMTIRTRKEEPIRTMAELIAGEARRAVADAETRIRTGQRVYVGVPTGFQKLDHNLGGTPIGIPTLIIARPGQGKTTLAMALNEGAGARGYDSVLASYEDSDESFGQRGLAKESDLATDMIRARRLDADAVVEIVSAHAASVDRTEQVIVASGMSVETLVRRIERECVRRKTGGRRPLRQLVVDFVQKIHAERRFNRRDEEISYISNCLHNLAVRQRLALVECCALNRDSEHRDDPVPRLTDIRESGTLESDGKLIFGLDRPYLHEPNKKGSDGRPMWRENDLRCRVLKNHNGENLVDIILYWHLKSHAVYDSEVDYQTARALRRARSGR